MARTASAPGGTSLAGGSGIGRAGWFSSLAVYRQPRLIAILPSPLKWQAVDPGPYVRRRDRRIDAAEGTVRREGEAGCVG